MSCASNVPLYTPSRDINPLELFKTAIRTCLMELPPNDYQYRSIDDLDYGSNTPRRSRGHRSKSQSPDPEITNVSEGGHLLENNSSTADKTNEPSTRSALLIAKYDIPPVQRHQPQDRRQHEPD